MTANSEKRHTPATATQITRLLGPNTDGDLVEAVIRTGANEVEILQAKEWICADDYMGAGLKKPLNGRVNQVVQILQSDLEKAEFYER